MEGGTMWRFTIRELLILTVTAGLTVAWWMDHRQLEVDAHRWRNVAGGLEHIIGKRGHEVGVHNGRLWVGTKSRPRSLVEEVALEEFEPTLKEHEPPGRQLSSYYSNWPRTPP